MFCTGKTVQNRTDVLGTSVSDTGFAPWRLTAGPIQYLRSSIFFCAWQAAVASYCASDKVSMVVLFLRGFNLPRITFESERKCCSEPFCQVVCGMGFY